MGLIFRLFSANPVAFAISFQNPIGFGQLIKEGPDGRNGLSHRDDDDDPKHPAVVTEVVELRVSHG